MKDPKEKPSVPPKPSWLQGKSVESLQSRGSDHVTSPPDAAQINAQNEPNKQITTKPHPPPLTAKLKSKCMSLFHKKTKHKMKGGAHPLSPLALEHNGVDCNSAKTPQPNLLGQHTESCPSMRHMARSRSSNGDAPISSSSSISAKKMARSKSLDMKRARSWHSTYRELMTYGSSPTISEESPEEEWSNEDLESGSCDSDNTQQKTMETSINGQRTDSNLNNKYNRQRKLAVSQPSNGTIDLSVVDTQTIGNTAFNGSSSHDQNTRTQSTRNNNCDIWGDKNSNCIHDSRRTNYVMSRQQALSLPCDAPCSVIDRDDVYIRRVTSPGKKPWKVQRSISTDSGLGDRPVTMSPTFHSIYNLRVGDLEFV